MKFFKILLYIIIFLIVIFLIIAAFLPKEKIIQREITINNSSELIFIQVADFNNWEHWSPWKRMDSNATYVISEPSQGIGSSYEWEGEIIGEGKLETVVYEKYSNLEFNLYFNGNDEQPNKDIWTFDESENGTIVTWKTELNLGYPVARFLGLFIENMIGPQKEDGLKYLKEYVESLKKEENVDITLVNVEAKPIYFISEVSDMSDGDIPAKFTQIYGELGEFCGKNQIQMDGMPLAITTNFSMNPPKWSFNGAFVVTDNSKEPTGRIEKGMTYEGKAVKAVHIGPYDKSIDTYNAIDKYIKENGMEINGNSWEEYISDPGNTPEEELITHIYFPVK